MTHKGTVKIETKRLILRKFERSEIGIFEDFPCYENLEIYNWIIILKATNEAIGEINGFCYEESNQFCPGYKIGEKWRNNGYATEALRAIIKFMLEEICVNEVIAYHDFDNFYSGRVMQSAGMRFWKTVEREGKYGKMKRGLHWRIGKEIYV